MSENIVKKLLPMYVVIFFAFLGQSAATTILAPIVHQTDLLSLNAFWLDNQTLLSGILMGLYPVGQIIGSNIIGHMSDQYGRRPTLIASMVIAPISFTAIGLAISSGQLYLLMFCLIVTGLCEGNISIAHSMITDLVDSSNRQRFFGYMHIATSMAYIVGPLLFIPLSWFELPNNLYYTFPFYLMGSLSALNLIIITLQMEESSNHHTNTDNHIAWRDKLKQVLDQPNLKKQLIFNGMVYLMIMGFFRYYPIYMVDAFDFDVEHLACLIAICASVMMLANMGLNAKLARNFHPTSLASSSVMMISIGLITMTQAHYLVTLIPQLIFITLMIAICLPCCHTMLSNQAPVSQQGMIMGINQSIVVAASAFASMTCGMLGEYDLKTPLIALSITGIAAYLILRQQRNVQYTNNPETT